MLRIENVATIKKRKSSSFRGALLASGVMTFAGLGDALLYPLLPVYGKNMGFSVFFIGVLLSVNRFIRILVNTPIANIVSKLGMRNVLITSSVIAVLTTFFYGLKLGALSFLIARILWGLSYSGLKIATLNYAALSKSKSGLAFGVSNSIKALGALFILWLGPILIDTYGIEQGLFIVTAISATGIILAIVLPKHKKKQLEKVQTKKTFYPNSINLLVFILSMTIDGILVVVLSYLLTEKYPDTNQLLAVVAFYLLLKRLFVLILSLISGFITLKISANKLFNIAVLFCTIGLFMISIDLILPGIIVVFMFNPVIVTFSPWVAIEQQQKNKNTLQAISNVSTWWDLGAAIGAFVGIFLIEKVGYQYLFSTLIIFILILYINYFLKNARTNRTSV